jgi:O-antigen/teichoic acid export membrane protein
MLSALFERISLYLGVRISSLTFQTIQVFFARVGSLFLGLLSNLALTRWLGISAYGQYAYIIAWLLILSIPNMGMATLVVREIAIARRQDNKDMLGGFMRWSFLNTLWMSGVIALMGFFAVCISSAYSSRELQIAPLLGLAGIPLIYLQTHMGALFRGCRRVEWAAFLNETFSSALIFAWAGGCLLFGFLGTASMAMAGRLVMLGFVLAAFAFLWPRLNCPWHWKASAREKISAWRKSLSSLTVLKGVNIMGLRLPVLMLGFAIGPEPVALFSLASRIAEMVILALTIVILTTGPHLAELHAKQDYPRMQRLVTRSTIAVSVWAIPITLGLIFAGKWLLSWFGPKFVAGYPILVVLVIGQTVSAITGTVSLVMTMGGLERVVLKVQALGLIITGILCLVLIPVWGGLGAAIGSTAALIFWNITLAVQLYRRLGIASSFYTPSFFRQDNTPPNSTGFDSSGGIS